MGLLSVSMSVAWRIRNLCDEEMKPCVLFEIVTDVTAVSCVISAYAQFSLRGALVDCFGRLRIILHVRLLWFWSTLDLRSKFTWQGTTKLTTLAPTP